MDDIFVFDFDTRLFKFRFCRFFDNSSIKLLLGTFRCFIMKGKKICIRKGYSGSGKTVTLEIVQECLLCSDQS